MTSEERFQKIETLLLRMETDRDIAEHSFNKRLDKLTEMHAVLMEHQTESWKAIEAQREAIEAQRKAQKEFMEEQRKAAEVQRETQKKFSEEMHERQEHTDDKINILIDTVDRFIRRLDERENSK
jgi:hypothetical protein